MVVDDEVFGGQELPAAKARHGVVPARHGGQSSRPESGDGGEASGVDRQQRGEEKNPCSGELDSAEAADGVEDDDGFWAPWRVSGCTLGF